MSENGTEFKAGGAAVESRAVMAYGARGVEVKTLDDAWRLAKYIVASGFAPKGMERPESVLIACQMGAEIGLTPMASLQNLAVINGRPSIYGDAALALVRGSGLLQSYSQAMDGAGDGRKAIVRVTRRGEAEQVHEFSVADAKRAGLWGKAGPWSQYPDRMLLFRARGFALRDGFGDVLKGLKTSEEAADMPPEKDVTADVRVSAPRPVKRAPVFDRPAEPDTAAAVTEDPSPAPSVADPEPEDSAPEGAGEAPASASDAPAKSDEEDRKALIAKLEVLARNRDMTFRRFVRKHGVAFKDWRDAPADTLAAILAEFDAVPDAGVTP